jgi:hypothetical protein
MNLLAQRNAVDELHGDEIHAIAFTNFIDMSDVRMIQSRRGFRLLGKAPHPILIAGEFGGKNNATLRSSFVSCARYTSPIPPSPIFARIS